MTTALTTRVTAGTGATVKGTPLTNAEIDANFLSLNDNKLETSWTGNTSIVTLGTVTTGTWNATTIAINKGGTGLTSTPSNGQIDIGNGTGFTRTTLTGTANQVSVTNGSGSITLATPQDIATSSNVRFSSIGIGVAATGTAGEIVASGDITAWYSDERLKTNVKIIEDALSKLVSLRGVTYNANQLAESYGYSTKESHVGVIAQDVLAVVPEAVKPAPFDTMHLNEGVVSKSGENYLTVQYEKLIPLIIEAIKQLNDEVRVLKHGSNGTL